MIYSRKRVELMLDTDVYKVNTTWSDCVHCSVSCFLVEAGAHFMSHVLYFNDLFHYLDV